MQHLKDQPDVPLPKGVVVHLASAAADRSMSAAIERLDLLLVELMAVLGGRHSSERLSQMRSRLQTISRNLVRID